MGFLNRKDVLFIGLLAALILVVLPLGLEPFRYCWRSRDGFGRRVDLRRMGLERPHS